MKRTDRSPLASFRHAASCILPLILVPAAQAASIRSLGDFPDGYWSRATAVSADGKVVSGVSYWFDGTRHAFRWTEQSGLVDLGGLEGSTDNAATTLSTSGQVLAGFAGLQGFRVDAASPLANLGRLTPNTPVVPLGANVDGTRIVGFDGTLPFVWRSGTGISPLPLLPGLTDGQAVAITPDGLTIGGHQGHNLVRWLNGIASQLAAGTSDARYNASAISSEGNLLAGRIVRNGGNGADAFRWVEGLGTTQLADLPGGDSLAAVQGVSSDGWTQVGFGSEIPFWTKATVWRGANPPQTLESILEAQGVDLAYWDSLDEAYAISADGRFIVGSGTVASTFLQEAFLAEIAPEIAPQSPFAGPPIGVPGRSQAEHFDQGGQLAAYFDTTAGNSGTAFRATDVDLASNTLTSGGVSIRFAAREWTEHTIQIPASGTFILRFQVATPTTGSAIKILLGSGASLPSVLVQNLALPRTGSTTAYTFVEAEAPLPAGTCVLRVCASGPDFYLNAIEVMPRGAYQEIWRNVSGTRTSQIPLTTPPTETGFLPALETAGNLGDNYGTRLRAYLRAPATGSYRFWIASDNDSDLYLSTTQSPANRRRIASVSGTTTPRQWNRYPSQKSTSISLVAGQLYYVEVLQKESTGADHVSVGWSRPGQSTTAPFEVVPGSVLSAFTP